MGGWSAGMALGAGTRDWMAGMSAVREAGVGGRRGEQGSTVGAWVAGWWRKGRGAGVGCRGGQERGVQGRRRPGAMGRGTERCLRHRAYRIYRAYRMR